MSKKEPQGGPRALRAGGCEAGGPEGPEAAEGAGQHPAPVTSRRRPTGTGPSGRTALHCTALHCTALHCTALHCTGPSARRQ
jgi:hypothetical protein